jgi:hypothetical protein
MVGRSATKLIDYISRVEQNTGGYLFINYNGVKLICLRMTIKAQASLTSLFQILKCIPNNNLKIIAMIQYIDRK